MGGTKSHGPITFQELVLSCLKFIAGYELIRNIVQSEMFISGAVRLV